MVKRGRPFALDDVKRREVCALVSAGCGLADAAEYVGCAASTIRRTATRDKKFHNQLREAGLAAELKPLHAMRQAASTHWRAAAWLLERINPDRYTASKANFYKADVIDRYIHQVVEAVREEVKDHETVERINKRVMGARRLLLS